MYCKVGTGGQMGGGLSEMNPESDPHPPQPKFASLLLLVLYQYSETRLNGIE